MSNIKYNIIHFLKHNNLGHYKPIKKMRHLDPACHTDPNSCVTKTALHTGMKMPQPVSRR